MAQLFEMERERRRRDLQRVGYGAHGRAFRSGFHEEPKDIEARSLRERGESSENSICFHISIIIESLVCCQATIYSDRLEGDFLSGTAMRRHLQFF